MRIYAFLGIKQLPASSGHLIGMTVFRFSVEKKKKNSRKKLLILSIYAEENFLLFTVEACLKISFIHPLGKCHITSQRSEQAHFEEYEWEAS